jgi:hypothetical protein
MGQFIPSTFQHFQQQSNQSPGLLGGTKYIIPGQNIPLPLGPHQTQFPMYSSFSQAQNQNIPFPANIPPPFQKGSIIQLKSGDLKRVEDLKTEDFVHSVNLCPELKLETSTVISIRKNDEVGMSLIGFSINSTKTQVSPKKHFFPTKACLLITLQTTYITNQFPSPYHPLAISPYHPLAITLPPTCHHNNNPSSYLPSANQPPVTLPTMYHHFTNHIPSPYQPLAITLLTTCHHNNYQAPSSY